MPILPVSEARPINLNKRGPNRGIGREKTRSQFTIVVGDGGENILRRLKQPGVELNNKM